MDDNSKLDAMSDHELLVELVKAQRETASKQKTTMLITLATFAIILIALIIVVPKSLMTMSRVEDMTKDTKAVAEKTEALVEQAGESLEGIDQMVRDVDQLVTENNEAVSDAMDNFNSVDFDRLNDAIDDLASIIEPLANLLGH